MCIAPKQDDDDRRLAIPKTAEEVPLGDGLADQARLSILQRRERIRQAVEAGE